MPTDTTFWIVVAVLVATVVALAIWKNRGINVALGLKGLKVGTQASKDSTAGSSNVVKVAEGLKLGDNVQAGRITGRDIPAGASTSGSEVTEVSKNMTIGKDGKVGDITGVSVRRPDEPGR